MSSRTEGRAKGFFREHIFEIGLALMLLTLAVVLIKLSSSSANAEPSSETVQLTQDNLDPDWFGEQHLMLQDGRKLTCVRFSDKAISCDWDNARVPLAE